MATTMTAQKALKRILSSTNQVSWHQNHRQFWGWLNAIFNKVDNDRIKEVGPDRACAEWLLRCGAHVRWVDGKMFQTDYNKLPPGRFDMYKIEEIDADNAAVMGIGFPHFKDCKYIKKVRFHYCNYLDDDSLAQLDYLKDTLQHLEISSCGNVSENGLSSLVQLQLLKTLELYDLPEIKNKPSLMQIMRKKLPNCVIEWPDLLKDPSRKN